MQVGITGHQHLENEKAWTWVEKGMRSVLEEFSEELTGISSLAVGADQLFARIVLEIGGSLHVVIPFLGYERAFDNDEDLQAYRSYLGRAEHVETLGPPSDKEHAYLAAGERVVQLSDCVIAVWDGMPARGLGGTADVVGLAVAKGVKVVCIDPVNRRIGSP
jgi:hypothetical protein